MVPYPSSRPDEPADPDPTGPPTGSAGLLGRMADEMTLRGYARRTRKVYLGHARRFLEFIDRDPRDQPTECARRFLLHLIRVRKVSPSYVNQAVSALKLFYREVLDVEAPELKLPRPKVEKKLPVVPSVEEVARRLGAVSNPKHRAILMVIYAGGLRVGEVVRLKVSDIDSDRMQIRVRQGKGNKDRYTLLAAFALEELRAYWKLDRPGKWLFPGGRPGRHLTERSVQKVFKRAARKAGIRKELSVHSLRHAFATHATEAGIGLRMIQKLLGHKSSKTTEIYTKVSRRTLGGIQSPLDRLAQEGLLEGPADRADEGAEGSDSEGRAPEEDPEEPEDPQ